MRAGVVMQAGVREEGQGLPLRGEDSVWKELTIAIPAYARPMELDELLRSVARLDLLPGELLICEDGSEERCRIREIVESWAPVLGERECKLTYVENDHNLGYDGNVRSLFVRASGNWVMLIGNDDLVLRGAVREVRQFASVNPHVSMISAAYLKFRGGSDRTLGLCRLSAYPRIYDQRNASARSFVRLAGFVGGLVFRRSFALEASTGAYDGTLYYQIYLAALAYCTTGIGYISTPTVASRMGNAPLFGAASPERSVHRPGRYSADARLAMWEGLLRICRDVEVQTGIPLVKDVRNELARRQSFHVFEAVAVQGRAESLRLARGLSRMGLLSGWVTWVVAIASIGFGRKAALLFRSARSAQSACAVGVERLRALVGRAAFPT